MAFPIKICSICSEEFELRPGKPGFANRCPACSEDDPAITGRPEKDGRGDKAGQQADRDLTDARRKAMRDLLYRKDS
jgi:hypothetical protein